MAEYKAKSGKLNFKGENTSKKRKKRKAEEAADNEGTQEGWVLADAPSDFAGPLVFAFNSEPPSCLYCSEKGGTIDIRPMPAGQQTSAYEPDDVGCVFVGSCIVGSSDRISLKTCDGKYLASDKFGVITAEREAIGPQEEWTPVIRGDGIGLQNVYDKFLSVDEIAGGGFKLRADAESIGFCETWQVKCQARFKKKTKLDKKDTKDVAEIEAEKSRTYQAWGGGRVKISKDESSELKKARKEGNLAEAMLDRREKVKSDRYCK